MLIWEIDAADHRSVGAATWDRMAALLRDAGLVCEAPKLRQQGDVVELRIATPSPGATVLRVVPTQQRRRELEDVGAAEPVVALPLLPQSAPETASETAPQPRRLLSFGHLARDAAPAELALVMQAFIDTFGIDDDVCLAIAGADAAVVDATWQRLAAPVAAPPLLRRLPDAAAAAACDVLVSVDTGPRLQPWLMDGAARGAALVAPRVGGQRDWLAADAAHLVDCRAEPLQASDGVRCAVVPAHLQVQLQQAARAAGTQPAPRQGSPSRLPDRDAAAIAAQLATLARHDRTPAPAPELMAWVSTWNIKCGIASHVRNQLASVDTAQHVVLAARSELPLGPDGANVARCWDSSKTSNRLGDALGEIDRRGITSVVIHFNWGFFHPGELSGFIKCLVERGIVVFVDLHSTIDPPTDERLAHLAPALRSCDRVLAHGRGDVDRLLRVHVDANVRMLPLGVLTWPAIAPVAAPPGPVPLLATFGYSFPNKGLVEFVQAVALLRQRGVRVRALMLNAQHTDPASAAVVARVRREIRTLGLDADIDFRSDYLDDEQCVRMLSEADLIVNSYQQTSESASAAVRYCMAARRPVLVTPLDIFRDLGEAVFRTRDITPEGLADGIVATLAALTAGTPDAAATARAAAQWLATHDVAGQAARLALQASAIRRNRAVLSPT